MPKTEGDAIDGAYQDKLKTFYDALFEAYIKAQGPTAAGRLRKGLPKGSKLHAMQETAR